MEQQKEPTTTGELRTVLASILAGALNGSVKEREGRLALTAATRITESFQAETRMRQLAIVARETPLPMGDQPLRGNKEEPPAS